ncbi:MAG: hypothetical protein IH830_06460 [Planctomycetes bacterium]|nr:hypothetical protein [Planctomycetota bacterium]
MIEKPAAPSHSAAPQRCPTCGYDLRGSASPVCPECGTPKTWRRLRFFDRAQLLEVLKILTDAGVAHRGSDGEAGQAVLGQIFMGASAAMEIWIGEPDAERAIEALDSEGIAFPLPIVDRAEPACPSCSTPLHPSAPASCPACGTIFQWVQIENEEPDAPAPPTHPDRAPRVRRHVGALFVGFGILCLLSAPLLLGSGVGGTWSTLSSAAFFILIGAALLRAPSPRNTRQHG